MRTQILNLLQVTDNEYEVIVISKFLSWCNNHQKSDKEAQRLLISPALFNWWYNQYSNLEQNFIAIITPYKSALNKEAIKKVYDQETLQMYNLFSKPLIYCAKHKTQQILGNPLYN